MGTDSVSVVREVVAVFVNGGQLHQAVDALAPAGVQHDQLGLLATENSVKISLGDFYDHTNMTFDGTKAPVTAFVNKKTGDTEQSSFGGSLFFVGTSGAMGAVVASSAIFGGALLGALSGVVALGVIGAVVGRIIHQSDADYLQKHLDNGHVLLFVRIMDKDSEAEIKRILNEYSAEPVRVYKVDPAGTSTSA